jgi:hypothetical protein
MAQPSAVRNVGRIYGWAVSRLTLVEGLSEQTLARLRALTEPRLPCPGRRGPWDPIAPHPKQAAFLCVNAREALFGGAAGGGKSVALLKGALQYVCVPGYRALLLRQTFPQLEGEEGLIFLAKEWLGENLSKAMMPMARARELGIVHWSEQRHRLTFPSGATVAFGHLQHDQDKHQYQGLAYQYVGFDELTHWADSRAYTFVGFSRVRKKRNVCLACAGWLTARPGEPGSFDHQACSDCGGVLAGEEGEADSCAKHLHGPACKKALPSLAFCPGCGLTVADVPLRTRAGSNPGARGHAWVKLRFMTDGPAKGRIFIRSRIEDNPSLDKASYVAGLDELDPVERARMLSGDWEITEEGRMFARAWFVDAA